MEASRQWASRPADQRFQTLDALRESVHKRRARSMASDMLLADLGVKADGEVLVINSGISPVEPTHWSFGQLCSNIGAPASWLRKVPTNLCVDNLTYALKASEREQVKVMTVRNDEGGLNVMQAVTSTTYGRIWDADVVDCIGRIVERTNNKFYNPKAYDPATGQPVPSGLYASDRDCFIFMIDGGSVFDAGPRAQLNRGFFAWNSEVGSKTFGLTTFLFNIVCANHICWGAQDINRMVVRHTSGGPARFDRNAVPALLDYTRQTPELDAIKRAQSLALSKVLTVPDEKVLSDSWQRAFAAKHNVTRGELREAIATAEREEGKCETVWDLLQGFTAHARKYEHMDTRVDLEMRAGKLLNIVAG